MPFPIRDTRPSDPRRPTSQGRDNRRSGVLGRRSRFAARPLRWSDLDRLLELADGPAPCQISIPEPVFRDARRMLRKKPGNVKKVDGHNEPPHSLGEALAVLRRRRRVFVRGRSINELLWVLCSISVVFGIGDLVIQRGVGDVVTGVVLLLLGTFGLVFGTKGQAH